MHGYDPLTYPEGVPNPYTATIEPYPSYMYGNDYTRPQFAMPFVSQPHNVLAGLGTTEAGALRNKGILYGAGFMAAAAGLLALASMPSGRRGSGALMAGLVGGVLGAVSGGLAASAAQGEI
jgi:hypothetical protein